MNHNDSFDFQKLRNIENAHIRLLKNFRELRKAWFYNHLASYEHERDDSYENDDRRKFREEQNESEWLKYSEQTEDIIAGKDRCLTPTCLNDLYRKDEVHVWEHPEIDFSPPVAEIKLNSSLKEYAATFHVTYDQIMEACEFVVTKDRPAIYPGNLTEEELEEANENIDKYELWGEWAGENNHEFENVGSSCCPEYCYPECALFERKEA